MEEIVTFFSHIIVFGKNKVCGGIGGFKPKLAKLFGCVFPHPYNFATVFKGVKLIRHNPQTCRHGPSVNVIGVG